MFNFSATLTEIVYEKKKNVIINVLANVSRQFWVYTVQHESEIKF